MVIKLDALRVFAAVAETGNIKDAADTIGRTASAVSMTLKQLEDEVGGALFLTDRKNTLTALGKMMFDTARTHIRSFDKSIDSLKAFAQSRIGRLTIASVPSFATNILPAVLPGFISKHPQVEIELFDMDSAQVRNLVDLGIADIGFAGEMRSLGGLQATPIFRDQFKVLCSERNPLSKVSRGLDFCDLEGQNLIRNTSSDAIEDPVYRAIADRAHLSVHNVVSLLALVRDNIGITVLPALASIGGPEGITVCNLRDQSFSRTMCMFEPSEKGQSPVAQTFRNYAMESLPRTLSGLRTKASFEVG